MTVKELANKSNIHFNQNNITLRVCGKSDENLIAQGNLEVLPEEIKNRTVISWVVSRASKGDRISELVVLTK